MPEDENTPEQTTPEQAEPTGAPEDGAPETPDDAGAASFEIPDIQPGESRAGGSEKISLLNDVNLQVKIELGRTRMLLEDVLKLADGAVIELDKLAGDPVDVYVNERHVARGEILVLNDNFCVRLSEIIDAEDERARRAG